MRPKVIGLALLCWVLSLAASNVMAQPGDSSWNGWVPNYPNQDPYTVNYPSMDLPYLANLSGWDQAKYYMTIRVGDVDGDGTTDLVARSPEGVELWRYDRYTYGYWVPTLLPPHDGGIFKGGDWDQPYSYATILLADLDGDGAQELVGRGPNGLVAHKYQPATNTWLQLPAGPAWSNYPWSDASCYTTIQTARLNGGLRQYVVGRCQDGLHAAYFDAQANQWRQLPVNPELSDAADFKYPQYYKTLRFADVDGDGSDEMLVRRSKGFMTMRYNPTSGQWETLALNSPSLTDDDGWNQPCYYENIFTGDVNGDGRQELIVRAKGGIQSYTYQNNAYSLQSVLYGFSDDGGWSAPLYYRTIRVGDVDGDGRAEVLGRHSTLGIIAYHQDSGQWNMLDASLPLSDARGWDQPQYLNTFMLAPATAGPSGKKQIMIRSQGGMRTYDFQPIDSGSGTWSVAARQYPDYANGSPDEQAAYQAVLNHLAAQDLIPPGTDLRALYGQLKYDWVGFDDEIDSTPNPVGVPQDVIQRVKDQLKQEVNILHNAWALLQGSQGLKHFFTSVAMGDWQAEIDDAKTLVKHIEDKSLGKFLLSMAVEDAIDLSVLFLPEEAIPAKIGKFVVEKVLSGVFKGSEHAVEASGDSDEEVDIAAGQLSQSLVDFKNSSLGKLDTFHNDAAQCWAKANLLSELQLYPGFDYVTAFDQLNQKIDIVWKTYVYKTLMPLAYNMYVWLHCYFNGAPANNYYQLAEGGYEGVWDVYKLSNPASDKPSQELMSDIWDTCKVSRQDFFKNYNGWRFPIRNQPCSNIDSR